MPLLRTLRHVRLDPPVDQSPIELLVQDLSDSCSSIPKRNHLRHCTSHHENTSPPATVCRVWSDADGALRSSTPKHKVMGSLRIRFLKQGREPRLEHGPLVAGPSSTRIPVPATGAGRKVRRKVTLDPSRHKSLPPIPDSPSTPHRHSNGVDPHSTPLPPPLEQLPVRTDSVHRVRHQPVAMGFSPAQAQHVMIPPVPEIHQPNGGAQNAPTNSGPPPGSEKALANRQDGLPYTLVKAERRHCEPIGMNPPPLGTTHVLLDGHGSDGQRLGIDFDFLGLLSPDRQIFGALARPLSTDLAGFPRMVAVKMIRKAELVAKNERYLWLCCEVETMKKLAGKDFVNGALAVFQDHDFVYIVSRWYAGSLSDYIESWSDHTLASLRRLVPQRQSPVLSPLVFRFYAGELLLGMQTLRKMNIVHADLKPDNVLVSPSGHLVLADFDRSFVDISRAMQEQRCKYEDVSLDIASGTTRYMAPEVIKHLMWQPNSPIAREPVTPRADLWSLGLTLLELALSAIPVFGTKYSPGTFHEGFFEVLSMHSNNIPASRDISGQERLARIMDPGHLHRCKTFFHDDVYDFIEKLMSTEPKARGTIAGLMRHSLFKSMDWNELRTSTPKLVEAGACPRQERAAIGPLNLPPASLFRPFVEGRGISDLFPNDDPIILSYDQFSDWIAPCSSAGFSRADDPHGLVVPIQEFPLQTPAVPHMGR